MSDEDAIIDEITGGEWSVFANTGVHKKASPKTAAEPMRRRMCLEDRKLKMYVEVFIVRAS